MVTSKVFLVLCGASLSVAAPQGLLLRSESSVNTDNVVEEVITALGPSVAEAVAQALRTLQGQAEAEAKAERIETARLEAERLEAARIEASRLEAVRLKAEKESAAKATASAVAVQSQYPAAKPVYNFLYKVADDKDQTYISRNEERDGDDLEGTYSYVDANGALITVNYQAGAMGYTETREEQANFVKIRSKPKTEVVAKKSSSQIDQASLIAQILSVLKPQIGQVVLSTLSAREEAEAARIESARIEAARIEAARIEAARIEAARIEAARIEAARLEAARVEAARIEAETIEAQRQAAAEAARVEAARVEAARTEAARIEAARIEAARVEAARIEAARNEAARIEAARIEAARVEAARIEAAKTSTSVSRSRSGLFGDGQFNVKINTPDFTVQY